MNDEARHFLAFIVLTRWGFIAYRNLDSIKSYNGWNFQISAILLLKIAQNGRNLKIPSFITLD